MITYNELYEVLRKERYSEQLQPLPKNFLKDVADYFEEKKDTGEKERSMFSEAVIKNKKQYENAISIFRELMLKRKRKLLNLSFIAAETGISKRDFENMLPFEKELFEGIMESFEQSEKGMEKLMQSGEKKEVKHKLVMFLQNADEFVGLNGESYGPYKEGNLANLPKEIVDILISDKKVELVDED